MKKGRGKKMLSLEGRSCDVPFWEGGTHARTLCGLSLALHNILGSTRIFLLHTLYSPASKTEALCFYSRSMRFAAPHGVGGTSTKRARISSSRARSKLP
jgi:hypothetical protein